MISINRHEPKTDALFSLLDDMVVERGTKKDWDRLHHLHYKAANLPVAPHFYRCRLKSNGDLVAVCVTSAVSLLLGPRHDLLPKLKPGGDTHLTNRHRPAWLNKNMRRIGRIVTSTMYRGTGVGYRMMNLVARMEGVRYMEIVSSMAKFNPFDIKAGYRRAPLRRAAAYEIGVKFLRELFECHPADQMSLIEEYYAQPKSIQKMLKTKLTEFYYRHSSKEKTGANLGKTQNDLVDMPIEELVRELSQLIFAHTVYSLYENPDFEHKVPNQLLLTQFDLQDVDQPLNKDVHHA